VPEIKGRRMGTAQHAAHAPPTPRIARTVFFMVALPFGVVDIDSL
jgi:hypothetical protein